MSDLRWVSDKELPNKFKLRLNSMSKYKASRPVLCTQKQKEPHLLAVVHSKRYFTAVTKRKN